MDLTRQASLDVCVERKGKKTHKCETFRRRQSY